MSGQVKEVSIQYQVSHDSCDSEDSVGGQGCPRGYKQTEVGVIPEDWEVDLISSACSMKSGESITSASIDDSSKYPCYGGNGLRGHTKRFTHDGEYALIGRQGALCGNVMGVKGAFFASEHAIVVTPKKQTNIDWLTYILRRMNLNQYSESSAQPGLSVSKLLVFRLVLPTKEEQTAIANALSDVDALIISLEKLIAKKRAIKTATMQQLLTGKKRLPPFDHAHTGYKQTEQGEIPEDWEAGELGDYLESCSSGATPYRGTPKFYKGNIRWISSGELNYNVIYDTIEKISDEAVKKTNLKIHPKGTFLMAITGLEAAGTRGSCGIVGAPSATNQSCMALYPNKKLSTDFLFHYYVYKGDELALKYCQGTKQQSYTAKLVRVLPLIIPGTIEEQNAIATALSDMDKEIESIGNRLNKTQQLKQGMMQELLTGRTRLI